MRGKCVLAAAVLLGFPSGLAAEAPSGAPDPAILNAVRPAGLRAHMRFLASDLLEGRAPHTRGYSVAAAYVASQFEALGLEPAGEAGSYLQPVPFRKARPMGEHNAVILRRRGRAETLEHGKEVLVAANLHREEASVRGEVVFVGFGITAPELDYDDYAGVDVDVKGKIVAVLSGAPERFPPDLRAHHGRPRRLANAAAHGAAGMLLLRSLATERRFGWERTRRFLERGKPHWVTQNESPADAPPGIEGLALLNVDASRRLLKAGGLRWKDTLDRLDQGRFKARVLRVTAEIRTRSRHESLHSANVAALLRGSDPVLARETLIFSAHLDHMGRGPSEEGDDIYNGAYDNASGVAAVLEIARAFAHLPEPPRRSVLFLVVTGEEWGLQGSDFFAHHPTVPAAGIVADVNLDALLMLYPFQDVVAYGAQYSTLGALVKSSADAVGLRVSPDPWPRKRFFVRSDHYSFVRQGIPAIFLTPGFSSADAARDGRVLAEEWAREVYHSPADDMDQTFEFESGARIARLAFLVGYRVAQEPVPPRWLPDAPFGPIPGALRAQTRDQARPGTRGR